MRNAALTAYVDTAMPSELGKFQHATRALSGGPDLGTRSCGAIPASPTAFEPSLAGVAHKVEFQGAGRPKGACTVLKVTKVAGHRCSDVDRESSVSHVGEIEVEQSQRSAVGSGCQPSQPSALPTGEQNRRSLREIYKRNEKNVQGVLPFLT